MSAASHSITWRHPIGVTKVEIEGATAYAVRGLHSNPNYGVYFHFIYSFISFSLRICFELPIMFNIT